jgi:hypothetical protein
MPENFQKCIKFGSSKAVLPLPMTPAATMGVYRYIVIDRCYEGLVQ